ncbi:hypothetical protein B0T14DRAFT_529072 [Immersiella caudata]|uniref:Uncharacterized protein n=1 Tax=Immersiella caudata TaxID=314043 RepID=A0AA39WAR8_9PEZI|nr:hypothetical protein B0T14DRAFT_529072 [Immersiella caudata]
MEEPVQSLMRLWRMGWAPSALDWRVMGAQWTVATRPTTAVIKMEGRLNFVIARDLGGVEEASRSSLMFGRRW